jgi:hypothetical protein
VGDRAIARRAAVTAPLFTGYSVQRTVIPVEQKDKAGYTRGDVYRVSLEIEAQSDMTWVVVDDPIPAGAMILGSGSGGTRGRSRRREAGREAAAFTERTHEAFRAYYEFVPKGRFKVEYTAAPQQSRPIRSARHARRGDVCAGDVRRAAEYGVAVKP